MIKTFKDRHTAAIFMRQRTKRFGSDIARIAARKLHDLDKAMSLSDLRALPGNRLEVLRGSHHGQFSIRVNNQWRVCFIWSKGNAHEVEIVDYHS
ncbi:MAG: type II toxin-antitoxin system RelE/ParE family toxin [Alphaproteobacteria bacterium]